jgi:hypothetical protein
VRKLGFFRLILVGLILTLTVSPSFADKKKKKGAQKKQTETAKTEPITGFQEINFGLKFDEVKDKLEKKYPEKVKDEYSFDSEGNILCIDNFELGNLKLYLILQFDKEKVFQSFEFRTKPVSFNGRFVDAYEANYSYVELAHEQLLGILFSKYNQPNYTTDSTLRGAYESTSRNTIVPIGKWNMNNANVKYAMVNVGENMFRPRPVLAVKIGNNGYSYFFDTEFASMVDKEKASKVAEQTKESNKNLKLYKNIKKGSEEF